MSTNSSHHQVLVIGGGSAGISVASRLHGIDVGVVEPAEKHYYQPLWTLVGGGVFDRKASERDEATLIPPGVKWIKDAVESFDPANNAVSLRSGARLTYDWLVVAAGIQVNWSKVAGLAESLGKNGVCSNYSYDSVESTWENIRNFQGGTAIFTMPSGQIKCGGAPQKIMYLADDYFRKLGVRERSRVVYAAASPHMFAVDKYRAALEKVVERKGIECKFKHDLLEIRAPLKEAVFRKIDTGELVTLKYDMIHVTPPMSSPAFIAQSPLADADGWVEVDKQSLRHPRFPNVFSAGDCSSLPTSKTGAAIRKQAPVLVDNLRAAMAGKPVSASYDGYTSCPLVTGYGKLILAEFDYDKKPVETFPFDQSKERWSMWLLKKFLLPFLYWKGMLKGRA